MQGFALMLDVITNQKIIFSTDDVKEDFSTTYFSRGQKYFYNNRVTEWFVKPYLPDTSTQKIHGKVLGRANSTYDVDIQVGVYDDDLHAPSIYFNCDCSCPVGFDCKHAVALLLRVAMCCQYQPCHIDKPTSAYEYFRQFAAAHNSSDNASLSQWTNAITQKQTINTKKKKTNDVILYLLDVHHSEANAESQLTVSPVISRVLKKGGFGKDKPYKSGYASSERASTLEDKRILALLKSLQDGSYPYYNHLTVSLDAVEHVLPDLINTGRAYWQDIGDTALTTAIERDLELKWYIQPNGTQELTYCIDDMAPDKNFQLIPGSPLWYYSNKDNCCGHLRTDLPVDVIPKLLMIPAISPNNVDAVKKSLKAVMPEITNLPMPEHLKRTLPTEDIIPRVSLFLYGAESCKENYAYYYDIKPKVALAKLQFQYSSLSVSLDEAASTLTCYENGALLEIKRRMDIEQTCVEKIVENGIYPAGLNQQHEIDEGLRTSFLLGVGEDDESILSAVEKVNHLAHSNNWQVVIDESFPIQIADEIDEWYSNIEDDSSGIDWFSLTLGVVINGEKINLLPLLVDLIRYRFRRLDSRAISELPDDTPCSLKRENGHYICVPFPRVRGILLILCELFDEKPLDSGGALRLPQLQAPLLIEIEKAMGATELRWFGGERLRQFAHKLNDFAGIKTVKPAKSFKATLRPYQKQGLNWMQFLREYALGGILADDMGLGKTVQTLAHLSVEKDEKRLQKPTLLVAPTSLMSNWESEAKRFSPDLSVLILQGKDRKKKFDEIDKVDLVLTTYPLVVRDKETLLAHNYYYIILDEAQQIKNAKAKATQIILQLKAQHRLCLTGTPMENHLGELWSLFNFILPGLLGNTRRFREIFRSPIEKNNDRIRHQQLTTRIKPFMLRRGKNEVATELPSKTEIVRSIDIEGAQRDIYETVRLSMQSQVRDAISNKGYNKSQIVILDALLKLRQICCAPSLLKLKSIKKNIQSAKLDDLMAFLPNLIEEGRRVILFSSFTSMLELIKIELNKNNIDYVTLTGKTRDRKTPIETFQSGKVPLFLISLKAGGVGLNLTAADTVIHYDPWWNPAAEQQATDRAHRIGQKKPVFVYKLITKGTVEEKILSMQDKKRKLISGIVGERTQKSAQITQEDLNALFQPLT